MLESYQSIARRKQEDRQNRIPKEWRLATLPPPTRFNVTNLPRESGILTEEELSITEAYDAFALAQAIARRELSSVDVTRAFCKVR